MGEGGKKGLGILNRCVEEGGVKTIAENIKSLIC